MKRGQPAVDGAVQIQNPVTSCSGVHDVEGSWTIFRSPWVRRIWETDSDDVLTVGRASIRTWQVEIQAILDINQTGIKIVTCSCECKSPDRVKAAFNEVEASRNASG